MGGYNFDPLYLYGPGGFNNRYPNWNQGNSFQYYTGGSPSGLSNTYNYIDRTYQPESVQYTRISMNGWPYGDGSVGRSAIQSRSNRGPLMTALGSR